MMWWVYLHFFCWRCLLFKYNTALFGKNGCYWSESSWNVRSSHDVSHDSFLYTRWSDYTRCKSTQILGFDEMNLLLVGENSISRDDPSSSPRHCARGSKLTETAFCTGNFPFPTRHHCSVAGTSFLLTALQLHTTVCISSQHCSGMPLALTIGTSVMSCALISCVLCCLPLSVFLRETERGSIIV